jgi:hypothetical protein
VWGWSYLSLSISYFPVAIFTSSHGSIPVIYFTWRYFSLRLDDMSVRFQSAYKLLLYANNSTIFFYTKPRNYSQTIRSCILCIRNTLSLAQIRKLLKVADFQIKYYDHTIICQSKIKYLGIEWMSDCCLTPTRNRYIPSLFIPKYNGLVGCGFFMVSNATFNNIVAVSFIGGGKRNTRRKPKTCHKSLTNFIT